MTGGAPARWRRAPRGAGDDPVGAPAAPQMVALVLLCGLTVALLGGCVTPIDGARGFPPLFEHTRTEEGGRHWRVTPLVTYDREADERELAVLWPLFRDHRKERRRRLWLLPLWFHNRHVRPTGEADRDGFLLPIFYGHDPADGGYFCIVPLIGTIKGILAQDRIDMLLFPLYLRAVDRSKVSSNLLFPVFNKVSGPNRSGWRVFPFYGHYTGRTPEGTKKYDRRFYLWPFIHLQENNLDTERPVTVRWLWPLYGKIESPTRKKQSVLWPLLSHDHNHKEDVCSYSLFPWRLTWREGSLSQADFWPLFGFRETKHTRRRFLIWPIYREEKSEQKNHLHESRWLLPVYWHNRRVDRRDGRERSVTRIWPLCTWRRNRDESREFTLLDLLPFDDPEHVEHFYGRLWRIFRYVDRGHGEGSAWELLWGLASGERSPERKRWTILGGILERKRSADDSRWRILYIPFGG